MFRGRRKGSADLGEDINYTREKFKREGCAKLHKEAGMAGPSWKFYSFRRGDQSGKFLFIHRLGAKEFPCVIYSFKHPFHNFV